MKPKFKSRTPHTKQHFDTTTIGSRFIAPALPWIALVLGSIALLYIYPNPSKSRNLPNQHQNTPTSHSSASAPIATTPNPKNPAYTPSDPIPDDSVTNSSLQIPPHSISNLVSDIILDPSNQPTYSISQLVWPRPPQTIILSHKPYALLVTTNLIYRPCPCGFCDTSRSIAVPEHINSIGHDLIYSVSTQFLPVIYLPETNSIPSTFDF